MNRSHSVDSRGELNSRRRMRECNIDESMCCADDVGTYSECDGHGLQRTYCYNLSDVKDIV